MKRLRFLLLILVLLALALPVSNLIMGNPPNRLTELTTGDSHFIPAVTVLGQKCANCHLPGCDLPFYAKFPIAKSMIQEDIQIGSEYLNLGAALFPGDDRPVSEVVLAKTEYTVEQGTMPPHRYLLLHWNGGLSDSEKEDLFAWIKKVRSSHYATAGVSDTLKNEPIQPLPAEHGQDARKVALGNKIYHDKRLSGDDTISCATCHGLDKGGTDQLQFSKGINDAVGDINSPTVFNSGYQIKQFWDGRAADLEEQADGPVNNPIEMGANWPDVIAKLEKDDNFVKEFKAVYPDGLKTEHFLDAIATFERSLITPNSKFDQYLMGNDTAITAEEKKGYEEFKEHGCATCHVGKIVGGRSFEKMGRMADYFESRGNVGKPDYGRFNVTANEKDRFKLKVPTLRNIALTAPYFHDGTQTDLKNVVKIMSECESGLDLPDHEAELIVKFLKTLTGEYDGKLL